MITPLATAFAMPAALLAATLAAAPPAAFATDSPPPQLPVTVTPRAPATAPLATSPASVLPSATATASDVPIPAATRTASPSPWPYSYRFVPRPPAHPSPDQPQIFAVYLNSDHLHSHGPIRIRVETNLATVKVESRNGGRSGIIPQVAPGVFETASTLPKVPFIAQGMTLDLAFVGTSATGRTAIVHVPVRLD